MNCMGYAMLMMGWDFVDSVVAMLWSSLWRDVTSLMHSTACWECWWGGRVCIVPVSRRILRKKRYFDAFRIYFERNLYWCCSHYYSCRPSLLLFAIDHHHPPIWTLITIRRKTIILDSLITILPCGEFCHWKRLIFKIKSLEDFSSVETSIGITQLLKHFLMFFITSKNEEFNG